MNQHAGLIEIRCPNCGASIPVSEAISHQIAERQQQAFAAREKQLSEKERAFDKKVEERVNAEQGRIEKEAQKKARQDFALEVEDWKQQAAEKDAKLIDFQNKELELRKEKRALEEEKKSFDHRV